MRDRNDKIEGPFLIDENLIFRGMIVGGATVRRGVMLELTGMITGDLDIEVGARAIVRGTVNGTVRNHGGYVEIFGSVGAVVDCSPEAQTIVALRSGRWSGVQLTPEHQQSGACPGNRPTR
jgi:hypothetical protein